MRLYVVLAVGAVAVITAVAMLPVVLGWPPATGDRWLAVGALATVVVAFATTSGLLGLVFIGREGRRAWQRMRAEVNPYLRVDFSLDAAGGTFTPPTIDQRFHFDYADFNPGTARPDSVLDRWAPVGNEMGVDLVLWIGNQQERAGGIAHNVTVELTIEIPDPQDESDLLGESHQVTLHYLEPGRRIRYRFATVSDSIPFLRGHVAMVSYYDMHRHRLYFAHGSGSFEWDGARLINHRQVFWSREHDGPRR